MYYSFAALDSNFSGTEEKQTLEAVLSQKTIDGYLRQVFVLTNGDVSCGDDVISLVKQYSDKARLFSLGMCQYLFYKYIPNRFIILIF